METTVYYDPRHCYEALSMRGRERGREVGQLTVIPRLLCETYYTAAFS